MSDKRIVSALLGLVSAERAFWPFAVTYVGLVKSQSFQLWWKKSNTFNCPFCRLWNGKGTSSTTAILEQSLTI